MNFKMFRSPLNRTMFFVCEVDEDENPIKQVTDELTFDEASNFLTKLEGN